VIINIVVAFAHRADPGGPWLQFAVGRTYCGLILAALLVSFAVMCLQVRPAVFGAARRAESAADARAEVADRMMLERLNAAMVAEGWRREGLTIGSLADELGLPEHRLRRLINQRLGHRNFAEFVNSYRIEAAKRRLADPAESLTTVAAIAFNLGYGSLGPFNRAFRSATGASPTEWRRQALAGASPKLEDAV
jgi:AraC-like DNA-binding protein